MSPVRRPPLRFTPRFLQFAVCGWFPPPVTPRFAPVRPKTACEQQGSGHMTLIQALGPNVTTVAMFFGVLSVSLAAVVIALLSDY